MKLPSTIKFASDKLCNEIYDLEKGNAKERELFKAVQKAMDAIEENAFCGIQIPKRQIPKDYISNYDADNLWKHNLHRGWRLIYTITRHDIIVISLLLECLSHKQYEKRFNY
ncbi:MAG: hypothetical protein PHO02_05620 [Candidatus Nanoarchaeia archaeon]|nr:hypothetical protein [Candidatus Nanoarchaeia archaeon]